MPYKTRDGKIHQTQVIIGENGFPVDTIATISGTYVFVEGTAVLTYDNGTGLVTTPVGTDLTDLSTARPRYTGKYILLTDDGTLYYINRNSIDVGARTFIVSTSDKTQVTPPTIDLTVGWKIAEADIVNRLATSAAAKIDSIEFRDLHFQMELDGDPVTLLDNSGNVINPATEETQLLNNSELIDINTELDQHTTELQEANVNLTNIDLELEQSNLSLDTLVNRSQALDSYVTHELDESGQTTYIGKMKDDNTWLLTRFVETGQATTIAYANESNNPSQTTFDDAWSARTSVTYTSIDNLTGV